MPILAVAATLLTAIGVVTSILGIVLLAGLVAGQFRKGVVTELRDSLATAKTENDLLSGRIDRMEADIKNLVEKVAKLNVENGVLRSALTESSHVREAVAEELSKHRADLLIAIQKAVELRP
jgi:UPF0716 family protein affecting phage T7 exclusion